MVNTPVIDPSLKKAEDRRDLLRNMSDFDVADRQDIIFRETSPDRKKTTIFSMSTGEPLVMPLYQARNAMNKTLSDGTPMFTSKQELAPEYRLGTIKCFLHAEAEEHSILEEIGLGGVHCPKATLSNVHSKRIHAKNRHQREWEAFQDHMADLDKAEEKVRQKEQLDATLALAGRAAQTATPVVESATVVVFCEVADCDYQGTAAQVRGHRMGGHKNGT